MDVTTLGASIAIAKSLPDTAVARAEAAAESAEASAERAEASAYSITVEGHKLIISDEGSE